MGWADLFSLQGQRDARRRRIGRRSRGFESRLVSLAMIRAGPEIGDEDPEKQK